MCQLFVAAGFNQHQSPSCPMLRQRSGTMPSRNVRGATTEDGELRLKTATITKRTGGEWVDQGWNGEQITGDGKAAQSVIRP